MNVLLLNGENVQTICVARSLKKKGHYVAIFANSKISSGYVSRYINRRIKVPDISHNPKEYAEILNSFLSANNIDLVIPMGDESATFLSRNKSELEARYNCICAVPKFSVFDIANDKQKLMELCEMYNFPHPKTRKIDSKNIDSVADYVGFPSMIKPNISAGAKGITKVDNLNSLKERLHDILNTYGECTLQQYVEQPPYYYNVMIYRDCNGKITGSTIIKILRYFPLKGGSSCYCQTIENAELLHVCTEILEKLQWHGFADFDILEDKHTHEYKIIEINPRVPSSLQASVAAGVDFVDLMLADLFKTDNPYQEYKAGKEIRWFGLDVMWFLFSKERFSYKPSWFSFWGNNVSYQDGSFKDPMPMIVGCLSGILKYINPKFRKSKLK